ncbi:MAG: pilus assembly PilX N-terminal domain-containing protein [Candidatus Kaiserbacteria bacterium]|nr:pilus assembly PilX N-terminal domain-containing protein [Candidatus Kaiserbacteria bacterium]MCB9816822.1 pilus assembly PilX N-terminal domain-containing protein [Candidatus Nomurabacteria bacterium]
MKHSPEQSGFALLISLIVVAAVISIGLAILDLSIKQISLSTNSKQSEIAFHAANAGMECAHFWRREESDAMELGNNISPDCFGVNSDPVSVAPTDLGGLGDVAGDGEAFLYKYTFSWPSGTPDRCTSVTALVASSTPLGVGTTVNNVETHVPGYPDGNSFVCESGSRCSVISVRGYNYPCSAIAGGNTRGIVEREVLLQF